MENITHVTYRKLTLEFINFLKKHNALEAFKQNTLKNMEKYRKTSLTQYTMVNPLIQPYLLPYNQRIAGYAIIDIAFVWRDTPQGHCFWQNINNEWNKYVHAKNFVIENEKLYKKEEG